MHQGPIIQTAAFLLSDSALRGRRRQWAMNESNLDATHAEYFKMLAALFRNHPVVAIAELSQKKTRFALSWAKSKG